MIIGWTKGMIGNHAIRVALIAVLGAGALTGCADEQTDQCLPREVVVVDDAGSDYRYVVSAVQMPSSAAEAAVLGFDLDGQGSPDNALGQILSLIDGYSEYDLSGEVNALVASAEVLQLIDVRATSLDSAGGVGVYVALGSDLDLEPGDNFSGTEPLETDPSIGPGQMSGDIADGTIYVELGTVPLAVTFPGLGERFVLDLTAARMEARITEQGIEGHIGGVISEESLQQSLLPAMQEGFRRAIATDCPERVCVADSFGERLLKLFDTEPFDSEISLDELLESSLVRSLLAPDVDIYNGSEIAPRCDGVKESLSIGIGFTAVRAEFPG